MSIVHASYFTDPASAWSWSIEPQLRRLEVDFGDEIEFTYVMTGIGQLPKPVAYAQEWLEASAAGGMPVDPRMWLADTGPTSSHPASLAVIAAAEQSDAGPYLRRLREGFAYEGRRLDRLDAFLAIAQEIGGLDVERFRIDASSHAIVESLGADIERARGIALPTIEFRGEDGVLHPVHGAQPYEAYRDAAIAAGAVLAETARPTVEEALRRWGRLATAEVAAACDLPGPRAAAALWGAAGDWRVRAERFGSGEVWSLA